MPKLYKALRRRISIFLTSVSQTSLSPPSSNPTLSQTTRFTPPKLCNCPQINTSFPTPSPPSETPLQTPPLAYQNPPPNREPPVSSPHYLSPRGRQRAPRRGTAHGTEREGQSHGNLVACSRQGMQLRGRTRTASADFTADCELGDLVAELGWAEKRKLVLSGPMVLRVSATERTDNSEGCLRVLLPIIEPALVTSFEGLLLMTKRCYALLAGPGAMGW